MTTLASPEVPELQVDYGLLSPEIHLAVERIIGERSHGWFRVAGVGEDAMDMIREVLRTSEGSRLPTYFYDGVGNYVRGGRTAQVEERHHRVDVIDSATDYPVGLWLQVPRYNAEPEEVHTGRTRLSRRELAALGATGVAVWSLDAASFATENVSLGIAGSLLAGSASIYAARRLMGPISKQE